MYFYVATEGRNRAVAVTAEVGAEPAGIFVDDLVYGRWGARVVLGGTAEDSKLRSKCWA